ncbi:MAG: protein jag [Streptococcaceae bacterium]|jgi:spoIIIJ-associated protein|nr:protein jag [Streptococcaceae bacterium]
MGIYTGNTVEEAIERGLKREKLARENAHIVIEQRESNGFLGFNKKRARVNIELLDQELVRKADRLATRGVTMDENDAPKAVSAMEATLELSKVVKAVREAGIHDDENLTQEEKEEKIAAIQNETLESPAGVIKTVKKSETSKFPKELTVTEDELATQLTDYLSAITHAMAVETVITSHKNGSTLVMHLASERDALLIGKHGKILQALETLARAVAHSVTSSHIRVTVTVGDYQNKREAYLTRLAHKAAEQVLATGQEVYIQDLPASERKIIHATISKIAGVTTHSEGRDNKRFMVVEPE